MADITQSQSLNGVSQIRFTALSNKGDIWMRKNYGKIDLDLDRDAAIEFKTAAGAAGIGIEAL